MYKFLIKTKTSKGSYAFIFVAALLLAFHYYFITYINSTFLEEIVGRNNVGILYAFGAILNIIIFLKAPRIIRRYSTYNFLIALSIFEIFCLSILALSNISYFIIIAFIIHHSINPVLLACLDVYLEDRSKPQNIGKIRGTFLTILSIAAVISPLAIGSLVKEGNFLYAYMFSGFFMILFLAFVILNFKNIPSGQFNKINVMPELREFFKDKAIRKISLCGMILQFFYSWMIIYVPIYLWQEMGFSWPNIALIISLSLIPFILFEIPIGELSDRTLNEREIMAMGFGLIAICLFLFPIIPAGSFILWTIIMILSRTGASIIEPANESYFFRHSKDKDELIGLYRIASPFAFIVGPLLGSIILLFLDFEDLFPILSCIMLLGVVVSLRLQKERPHLV